MNKHDDELTDAEIDAQARDILRRAAAGDIDAIQLCFDADDAEEDDDGE